MTLNAQNQNVWWSKEILQEANGMDVSATDRRHSQQWRCGKRNILKRLMYASNHFTTSKLHLIT